MIWEEFRLKVPPNRPPESTMLPVAFVLSFLLSAVYAYRLCKSTIR
jgi:hypothetical protein